MQTGQSNKLSISTLHFSLQDIAEKFDMKYNSLYRLIQRRKIKSCFITIKETSFVISGTSKKILLVPVEAVPVDVDEIENKAAVHVLTKLLPCLCSNCSDAVRKIKEVYERN